MTVFISDTNAILAENAINNATAFTTYHVLTDGRWEVRATPPCHGIKKNAPLSLGFYATEVDAKAAGIDYYEACPAISAVVSSLPEFRLRCENLALVMQVASLETVAKSWRPELVGLRERIRDLTLENISLKAPLPTGVTDRSNERELRRQSRAISPQEMLDMILKGC